MNGDHLVFTLDFGMLDGRTNVSIHALKARVAGA